MTGFLNASGGGMPAGGPWGGLPVAQAPWGGGQMWQAAQQSPWRQSPWQTQGMPSGAPVAPPPQIAPTPQQNYLPQGTSAGLNNFNPATPGGGFYPALLGGQQQRAPTTGGGAPPPPQFYSVTSPSGIPAAPGSPVGQMFTSKPAARQASTNWNNMIADSPMPNDWTAASRGRGFMGNLYG